MLTKNYTWVIDEKCKEIRRLESNRAFDRKLDEKNIKNEEEQRTIGTETKRCFSMHDEGHLSDSCVKIYERLLKLARRRNCTMQKRKPTSQYKTK